MELSMENIWYYNLPYPTQALDPTPSFHSEPSDDLNESGSPLLQDLHRAFDAMDSDHDGEISGHELCLWMKKLGLKFTEEGMIRIIDHSDVRKCGSLEFKDFVSLNKAIEADEEREELTCTAEEREAAHQAILAEVFELFDRNHDGLISPKELFDTLEGLGLVKKGGSAECVDMIRRVDSDGDGQVSFSEFQHMMDEKAMDFTI